MKEFWQVVVDEINKNLKSIKTKAYGEIFDYIVKAKNLFVYGQGRSGLIAEAFAMRLKQLGLNVFIVGLPDTPAITKNDLLIAITCSGETKLTIDIIEEARQYGARTIVITSSKENTAARIADYALIIKAKPSKQPLNSLFEQSTFLFLDSLILFLMKKLKVDEGFMKKHHANLE